MIVVHVLTDVLSGGVASMVRALITEQCKQGIQPVIVCRDLDEAAFEEWCTAKNMHIPYYGMAPFRRRFMTLLGGLSSKTQKLIERKFSGEEIIYHYHNPIACGMLFTRKGKAVCTIHGFVGTITSDRISNLIVRQTFRRLIKKGVSIVGCCDAVARFCNEKYNANKALSVLNGLESIDSKENEFVADNGKCHIGYTATINELKGWRILADAYIRLPQEKKEKSDLYFAGSVTDRDKAVFENFIKETNANYLGYVKDTGSSLIPFLDILVLPSKTEGLPMCILEAMQSGVIPIATRVGGIPELIHDGVSGLLIDRDSDSLSGALESVIGNAKYSNVIKEGAQRRFDQIGAAMRMEREYRAIYRGL